MKQCTVQNKKKYTHAGAIKAAISYSRKRGTPLRPYYHRACGSWHLTKTERISLPIG